MIRNALPEKWARQLEEQATPRAMAGLGLLVVIVLLWGLGELNATVTTLRQDVEELDRARRLEMSLLSDQGWLDQAGDLNARLAATQADFWDGDTTGIIAAQLQGAVERAARNAGLDRVRVNVEASPRPLGTQAQIFEISLTARDTDGQFLAFFQEISRVERQIVISRFIWRRNNGMLDVRLEAPALIATEGTAS